MNTEQKTSHKKSFFITVSEHFKRNRLICFAIHYFNNLNLHSKIVITYFFFVLLFVGILSTIIYTFTSRSIYRQNIFSFSQNYNQANSYLAYKIDSICSASDMLIYNVSLNEILNKKRDSYSIIEQTADSRSLLHLLKNMQENRDIARACLYVPDTLSYSDNNEYIRPFSQAESSAWYPALFARKGICLFVGSAQLEDLPYPDLPCISLFRAMYRQNDYSSLSFILRLDIPLTSIMPILNSANYSSDSFTLLTDLSGAVIVSSSISDSSSAAFSEEEFSLPDCPSGTPCRIQLNGTSYLILSAPLSGTDWRMTTLVPYNTFTMATTSLINTLLCVSTVVLLLAWLLSKPIAYSISNRIDILHLYMKDVQSGVLHPIPGSIYKDEIGLLTANYNFMIARIQSLLKENYQMGIDLKDAEYKALQSQINPHFLYNTLDMIRWFSYQNKAAQINETVCSLASFYKLSLSKGKYIVSIQNELEHVKYYMKIQEFRFGEDITFFTKIDPELLSFSIPKITLQPLVENALFHGILEKESPKGNIRIYGHYQKETLYLTVEDDGVGISPDKLGTLLKENSEGSTATSNGSHYGLLNIHRRLQLQYGESYGLSVESKEQVGTKVHILLPAIPADVQSIFEER
ncbi:MAG: sensor histidine kinase [Eubacteriales bacterium]|nr:sensor histidine kinase [Eubacteriales bacterium]